MKYSLLISLVFYVATTSAITADIYSNAQCSGTPQMSMTYTLNICKDVSQGGFAASMKPTVCNATWAAVNSYIGTATCSGSASSVQTGVPGTCINDEGSYVKINCADPSPQPFKSGVSEISLGLGALFVVIGALLL